MNDYKSPWWLPGPHLQTVWPSLRKRKIEIELVRERLWLPDGDFLDLDWTGGEGRPIVLILHGLTGSIESSYAKGMLRALQGAGLRGVFMHFRGCSGEPNRSALSYHAGETGDVGFVLQTLAKRGVPIAVVGFSLGGNVLLKYLGETGEDNPVSCAVAVSVPFLLNRFSDKVQTGFSSLYQRYLLSRLRGKIRDKAKRTPLPVDLEKLDQAKSFWDFDHEFTAKMHGFKGAKEYYEKSSSFHYLSRIRKKTLLIHALNDPFLPLDAIPQQDQLPDHVQLDLQQGGGHMGFMSGRLPWRPQYWLEERIPAYVRTSLLEESRSCSNP